MRALARCSLSLTRFLPSLARPGTIVGSAVFNIMIIVGVTAICAGQTLDITPYPFARDCA